MAAVDAQTAYGVNVKNKFAFLDDDEGADPSELLARAQKEKKEAKQKEKAATAKKEAVSREESAPAPAKAAEVQTNEAGGRPRFNGAPRGGGGYQRGTRTFDRAPRTDRPARNGRPGIKSADNKENYGRGNRGDTDEQLQGKTETAHNQSVEAAPKDESGQPQLSGGQPPLSGGYQRGPRTFDRVPRTDRHSRNARTGIKSVDKKDGHGRGNWGTTEEQLQVETEPAHNQSVEAAPKDESEQPQLGGETDEWPAAAVTEGGEAAPAATTEATAAAEATPVVEPEPEAPKLTLAEWKAQHAASKTDFKTRQANEGADAKSLQKFVPIARVEDEDDKKKAADADEKDALKKKQRNVVNIDISFNDPNRREHGGERRGDFKPRGGGGFSRSSNQSRGGGSGYNTNFNRGNGGSSSGGNSGSGGGGGSGGFTPNHSRGAGGNAPRRGPGPQLNLTSDFPALGAH